MLLVIQTGSCLWFFFAFEKKKEKRKKERKGMQIGGHHFQIAIRVQQLADGTISEFLHFRLFHNQQVARKLVTKPLLIEFDNLDFD